MRTLSEIDTTVKRASKAMGFSWGVAEEIGKNIRLLELFGLPGVKNLNQYFKDYKTKQFQKISLVSKLNESTTIPYCPIIFGTNFIDQCNALDELIDIEVKNVEHLTDIIAALRADPEINSVERARGDKKLKLH